MKSQKVSITLGKIRLTLGIGDENGNGVVDVSLTVRIIDLFELPPFVVDLDAALAQKAIDGFKNFGDAMRKQK